MTSLAPLSSAPFPPKSSPDLVDLLAQVHTLWRRDDGLAALALLESVLDAYPWSPEALSLYGTIKAATRHCFSPLAYYRLYEYAATWQAATGRPSEINDDVQRFSLMKGLIADWAGHQPHPVSVLDVAGADGAMAAHWVDLPNVACCLNLDISWLHISQGRQWRNLPTLFFVRGQGSSLPVKPLAFHIVLLSGILEHVPDPAAFVSEAHRVLTAPGLLVIQTPYGGTGHLERDPQGSLLPFRFHVNCVNPYEMAPWGKLVYSSFIDYTNTVPNPHAFHGTYGDHVVGYEKTAS